MPEMAWYIPLLIFFARVCDVSIGTVRTIFVIGGHQWLSALLGFFEVIIWVLAVGGVITHLTNVFAVLGYAGGFATGVIVGMAIESRLALGYRAVRAISTDVSVNLSERLRDCGFRVTKVQGSGRSGPVELAFMVVRRRELKALFSAIEKIDARAFISVGQADRPSITQSGEPTESRFSRLLWLRSGLMRK